MYSKTRVSDSITIIVEHKEIVVENSLHLDIAVEFTNKENEPTLDENGDLFESVYKCNVFVEPKYPVNFERLADVTDMSKTMSELKEFFKFIDRNKQNLFDEAGFKGALE